jgi:hypothetical protein
MKVKSDVFNEKMQGAANALLESIDTYVTEIARDEIDACDFNAMRVTLVGAVASWSVFKCSLFACLLKQAHQEKSRAVTRQDLQPMIDFFVKNLNEGIDHFFNDNISIMSDLEKSARSSYKKSKDRATKI